MGKESNHLRGTLRPEQRALKSRMILCVYRAGVLNGYDNMLYAVRNSTPDITVIIIPDNGRYSFKLSFSCLR